MKKIAGIGNALVDVLAKIDQDELLGKLGLIKGGMELIDERKLEEILGHFSKLSLTKATGGSACNAMLALANLGASPGLIGKVGCDTYGALFEGNCRDKGIAAKLLKSEVPTGIATTFISTDGERTFGTFLGAAALMSADEISSSLFEGYDYLLIEGYLVQNHALITRAAESAHQVGAKVCLDLASFNIVAAQLDFFRAFVSNHVDVVFANEEEAVAFTGKAPKEAVAEIAKYCAIAVVKMGPHGVYVATADDLIFEPSTAVECVVDSTAAGDFFAGGFLYALAHEASLDKCIQVGALLGGEVIQHVGTLLPDERWREIKLKVSAILMK